MDQRPGRSVPHSDTLIVRPRIDQTCAILTTRPPLHARNTAPVATENVLCTSSTDIPHSCRRVPTGTHNQPLPVLPEVVGFPGRLQHGIPVAAQFLIERLAGLGVPDPQRLVHAACGQQLAVGTPPHVEDPSRVSLESELWRPRVCVPYPGRAVAAPGGEAATRLGRELGREDRLTMARDPVREPGHRLDAEDGLRFGD